MEQDPAWEANSRLEYQKFRALYENRIFITVPTAAQHCP
jgi:hypothetical protein